MTVKKNLSNESGGLNIITLIVILIVVIGIAISYFMFIKKSPADKTVVTKKTTNIEEKTEDLIKDTNIDNEETDYDKEAKLELKISDLIDALQQKDDWKERKRAAQELIKIGDPAIQPLMDFFDEEAPYVLAWTYFLDKETLKGWLGNPIRTWVDFYLYHHFIAPDDVVEEIDNGLKMIVDKNVKRLLDVENEKYPNLIVKGLKDLCVKPDVENIWVEVTDYRRVEGLLLVTGTCTNKRTEEDARYKLISGFSGFGSGVNESGIYPK